MVPSKRQQARSIGAVICLLMAFSVTAASAQTCPLGQILFNGKCVSCPAGTIGVGNQCVYQFNCPPGTAFNATSNKCEACPAGNVPNLQQSGCILPNCPRGQAANAAGQCVPLGFTTVPQVLPPPVPPAPPPPRSR